MAVCGRCRKIVALAQRAAAVHEVDEVALDEAAVAAAAMAAIAVAAPARAPRASTPPRPWWRSWRLAWIPVAAFAAGAALAVYVHLARVERNTELAKNSPPELPKIQTAVMPAPQEQAKAAPASAPTPTVRVPQKPAAGSAGATSAPQTAEAPAAGPPPATVTETVAVSQAQPAIETDSAQLELRIAPQAAPKPNALFRVSPAMTPAEHRWQADGKKERKERNAQGEAAAVQADLLTASGGSASGEQSASSSGNAQVNSQATAQSEALESRRSIAGFGAVRGTPASTQASWSLAAVPIRLPSGLSAASLASANHRTIAIDSEGALFLREEGATAWQAVVPQWTGRAVLVRTRTIPLPAAAPSTDSLGKAASGAPAAAILFQLVNDKNEVWQSPDGTNWTAQ